MSLSTRKVTITDPVRVVDDLLQDTILFVMEILHNRELMRDTSFYRRGCKLVETLKKQLEALSVSDEFTEHMLHAQCCLVDEMVLNTAPLSENRIWLTAPLQARYLGTMHAGEALPERLRRLLRQPAPDTRLLIMYQRVFAMGLGRPSPGFQEERRQFMQSLDALVPATGWPQSVPLLVEHHPGRREGVFRSPVSHIALLTAITAMLWFGLSHSLSSFLHSAFSG